MSTADDATTGVHVLVDVPISFEVDGGTTVHSPMVHATVGGVATRLILDTGSTDHVLTKELVDRVGATARPGEDGIDHAGAAVPSYLVGDLEVQIAAQPFALRDVVAIAAPPPFVRWGVGGFLSPQHLHPTARVLIDMLNDRLVVVGSSVADVDAWLVARVPSLWPIVLDRIPGESTVAVPAAIEPFPAVPTMLNTGGRQTEFASTAIPGLRGIRNGRAAPASVGVASSGRTPANASCWSGTFGSGSAAWSFATRWRTRRVSSEWTSCATPRSSAAQMWAAASCGWCPEGQFSRTVLATRTPYPVSTTTMACRKARGDRGPARARGARTGRRS